MATSTLSSLLIANPFHTSVKQSEVSIYVDSPSQENVPSFDSMKEPTTSIHELGWNNSFDEDSHYDSDISSPSESEVSHSSPIHVDLFDTNQAASTGSPVLKNGLGRKVAILGVGYVGLHLTEEFGIRHNVTAFDVSQCRIDSVTPALKNLPLVKPTSNEADLAGAEYYLISVPTLVRPDETVDTSYIESAINLITRYAQPGATVVIESSVAVGMTRSLLAPLIQSKHLLGGMSPERVDPGRVFPTASQIPKIISGLDDLAPGSLASIFALYGTTFNTVVPVSKPEVAEMTKLYENCQRMMCIAYANEMADACIPHAIDPFEVCRAAETKPFGYAPYRPSAGVGGHCIPVNPYYLFSNSDFPLLHHATQAMNFRPAQIADRVMRNLYRRRRLSITQRHVETAVRVLVVGAGFKPGQSVLSNSPGLAIMRAFKEHWDAEVEFADPLVAQEAVKDIQKMDDHEWTSAHLANFDIVVVAMRQHGLDFAVLDNSEGPMVHYCCQ